MSRTVILIIAIFISSQSFGQERVNLFNTVDRATIGFTTEQSVKLDRMILNPIYLDHYFVDVNELEQVQEDGNITVNLPDKQNVELFIGKNIEYNSDDEFLYFGDFDPCDGERMGYIHLIAKNGNLFGQINIEEEIYELQDFGGRKNVLFKIDPSIYTEGECATEHERTDRGHIQPKSGTRSGGCDVRVLVLFTNAADAIGNPQNSAELFMQQTNQIINNSDAELHFTLAGVEELNSFVEAETAGVTRNNLQTNFIANQLRNNFEADLVVLLTDGNWIDAIGQTLGTSFLGNWGNPEFGYVVVEIDAAGGRFTFTHELAHDFGCKHDWDDRGAPDFVFDARGDDFWAPWYWPTRRRTVMTQLNEGARIMHFSNPDVKFKGKKTGEEDERENEDQLSAEGCTVSNYRPFTPPTPLTVHISGPIKGDNSGVYTWCVNIQNCSDPTSILWEYSIDGINYFPMATNEYCVTASLPLDRDLRLRVTVTCDGDVDTDWHYTFNLDGRNPCGKDPKFVEDDDIEASMKHSIEISSVNVYPNPTNQILSIDIEIDNDSTVEIELIDLTGKKVIEYGTFNYTKGFHNKSMDISKLQIGYYFVKVSIGTDVITKSIIKL